MNESIKEVNISKNPMPLGVGVSAKRQLKLVLAWAELHKDELMQNWELARLHERLNKISPLS